MAKEEEHYQPLQPMPLGIADGVVLLNNEIIYQARDLKVGLI